MSQLLRPLDEALDVFDDDLNTISEKVRDGLVVSHPKLGTRARLDAIKDTVVRRLDETFGPASERRTLLASEQRLVDRAGRMLDRINVLADQTNGVEGQIKANHARFAEAPSLPTSRKSEAAAPFTLPSLREYHEAKAGRIGSDPDGGYLVSDELGPIADRLRADAVVLQAGPRVVTMASDVYKLPKITASATAYAIGEGGTVTDSFPSFGQTQLTAQAYAARAVGSVEWFEDASSDPRAILSDDLGRQLALKSDLDFLSGDGTSTKPLIGFRNYVGVTKTELGSGAGATPTLDNLQDAVYRMRAANGRPSCWFMHPRTLNTFRKLKTGLSGDLTYLLRHEPTAGGPDTLFGLPVYVSSQIGITETVGGSTDCSYIVLADMSQVVVGVRGGVRVLFDEYSYASSRQVQVVMSMRVAFGLINVAGVELLTGVRP